MIGITGEIAGEIQLDRALSRLDAKTRDLREPFSKIGEDFRDIEKEQFDAEGYGWKPLSPVYAERKRARWGDKTILRASDRLYIAMTRKGAVNNVNTVKPLEAQFGARGRSGAIGFWHQIGAGNLPQRKVINLREQDKRQMIKTMHEYMVKIGQEAGFVVLK